MFDLQRHKLQLRQDHVAESFLPWGGVGGGNELVI